MSAARECAYAALIAAIWQDMSPKDGAAVSVLPFLSWILPGKCIPLGPIAAVTVGPF